MFFDESRLNSEMSPLVAFFHAQRTGGSAFKRFLRGYVGNENFYAEQTVNNFKHWKNLSEEELEAYSVFAGHSDFRSLRFSERNVLLVTLLRDPVYRAASLHQYCKNKEGHALQSLAKTTNMLEFYQRGCDVKPNYFLNVQCRRVCGKPSAREAIKIIENEYFAVGETDNLAMFSKRWANVMNWNAQFIDPQPKDEERYASLVSDAFRSEVVAGNREDSELYTYMKERYFS